MRNRCGDAGRSQSDNNAAAFSSVLRAAFGWPDAIAELIECLVGRPNWHHYLAFDGADPVATATMYTKPNLAWMDFASTLESHRRRGAQSALMARRINDSGGLGCTRAVVETADPGPERPIASHRNMVRLGFDLAYRRPNYILELT